MADVVRPTQQREQREEGAEDIFPLRDPGDGFHIDGVQTEERGDERAQPEATGEPMQREQEQHGGGSVPEHIFEMHELRIEAEEAHIRHEGAGGERHPEAGVRGGESGAHAVRRQTVADEGVFVDVAGVIEGDEGAIQHAGKCGENRGHECQRDEAEAGRVRKVVQVVDQDATQRSRRAATRFSAARSAARRSPP